MNTLIKAAVATAALSIFGCNATPAEPDIVVAQSSSRLFTVQASTPNAGGTPITGYKHSLAASSFWLGTETEQVSIMGGLRHVGTDGAFLELPNGYGAGRPNANSSIRDAAPLSDPDAHNAAVRSYFTGLGLPAEQIQQIVPDAIMATEGMTQNKTETSRKLVGYMSRLFRQVNGVPVQNSFAWARLDAAGRVVAESVWWPELPASVLADLADLQATVSDPDALIAYQATLPAELKGLPGTISIRHSAQVSTSLNVAVTYDVLDAAQQNHSFAKDGTPIDLFALRRSEVPDVPVDTK